MSLPDDAKDKFIERYTKAMDHVVSDLETECNQGNGRVDPQAASRVAVWTR